MLPYNLISYRLKIARPLKTLITTSNALCASNITTWTSTGPTSSTGAATPTARPAWRGISRRRSFACSGSARIVGRFRPTGKRWISLPLTSPSGMRSNSDQNYISKLMSCFNEYLELRRERCARTMNSTLANNRWSHPPSTAGSIPTNPASYLTASTSARRAIKPCARSARSTRSTGCTSWRTSKNTGMPLLTE